MQYVLPDGRTIAGGKPFELNGCAYAGNWLELSGQSDRDALGITTAVFNEPAPSLDAVKNALLGRVQMEFETQCGKVVTPGFAMANVYRVQSDEALNYNAKKVASQPLPACPSLEAIVGVLAPTLDEVATIVLQRMQASETAIAALNAKRLAAKLAIQNAPDAASATAAANVIW